MSGHACRTCFSASQLHRRYISSLTSRKQWLQSRSSNHPWSRKRQITMILGNWCTCAECRLVYGFSPYRVPYGFSPYSYSPKSALRTYLFIKIPLPVSHFSAFTLYQMHPLVYSTGDNVNNYGCTGQQSNFNTQSDCNYLLIYTQLVRSRLSTNIRLCYAPEITKEIAKFYLWEKFSRYKQERDTLR